jgi:hypothetical protein
MAMINHDITQLTVKEFLSNGRYVIPIYQRNYDWGEKETLQLIEDVADYAKEDSGRNYYIGSAIVFVRSNNGQEYFETIDGQQRLTTLTILTTLLKRMNLADWYKQANLSYDHRKEADDAITLLRDNRFSDHPVAQNINDVYRIMDKNLVQILDNKGLSLEEFAKYLFDKVVIIRIPVPQDTELNHYFEIMNTRGEQLEKHEVLKAVLMNDIDKTDHLLFHTIWEACSDMSSYVQMNFSVSQRNIIFSEKWNELLFNDFDELKDELVEEEESRVDSEDDAYKHTLAQLLQDSKSNVRYELPRDGSQDEGKQDRFGSIITFPNFLLQVLKVTYYDFELRQQELDEKIKLDDKRLIPIFQDVLKSLSNKSERQSFVKRFIMQLLSLRVKFDKYVIKREYLNGTESWSLKNIRKYDNNKASYVSTFSGDYDDETDVGKDIRMLEAMFHVSAPTQIYKHWLNAILFYVYTNDISDPRIFRDKLNLLACTYMSDVYLADERTDFEVIIYENDFKAKNHTLNWENIDQGCDVPNFVFNFYDYITWKQDPSRYPKFEFTYRTSVEHFYPQSPMPGYDDLKGKGLDDFGNLCLISRGMNSKFSNNMPKAKLDNFGMIDEVRNGLSIKLLEMMDVAKNRNDWGIEEIAEFENQARERLKKAIFASK